MVQVVALGGGDSDGDASLPQQQEQSVEVVGSKKGGANSTTGTESTGRRRSCSVSSAWSMETSASGMNNERAKLTEYRTRISHRK